MRGEPAERHRLVVRLPRQLVLRQTLQQPARFSHLMVVIRQQGVLDRHRDSVTLWVLCLLGALCAAACRRQPAAPPPPLVTEISGTLATSGLSAPVRILRDTWGVPHIYAANQDDLFFAQGFVQAQDRLFQMDLWRRSVQGRLSEVLGSNFVGRDAMTRRIQYRGNLE